MSKDKEKGEHKMLEVTISGTYHNSKKEIVDFEGVKGLIPYTDEPRAKMHIQRRYAMAWIKAAVDKSGKKIYTERVNRVRTVYFDNFEDKMGTLSYIGKDIKVMTFEELQDLATAKDLRFIPAVKEDMRVARIRAYATYSERVLKKTLDWQAAAFAEGFAKMPELIVSDADALEVEQTISNDEMIENEMSSTSTSDDPRTRFTMAELKKLANEKNIPYDQDIGFDDMYKKLYG